MKRPIIGVVPLYDEIKESYWMLPGYMKAIEEAGGIPVMLPLTTNEDILTTLAHAYDGFLFTGGHDMNPKIYGEEKLEACGPLCVERDLMESVLFREVLELDKPMFGICRGLQLFNVMLGGTLYQDIPNQREGMLNHMQKPPYTNLVHDIEIVKNSMLHKIVHTERFRVNSYHHQGIKELAPPLLPVAKSADDLIEAVVLPTKSFVLAVQWHPEFNYHIDEYSSRLFKAFVTACQ